MEQPLAQQVALGIDDALDTPQIATTYYYR